MTDAHTAAGSRRIRRAVLAVAVACTAVMATGAGTASAGTNYHCDNCIINSGAFDWSDYPSMITLEYVHRLSGPSSGVTIGAIAYYTDNYTWGNWATSTATEVTHAYSGSRPAYGVGANFGAGNYRFNAHMNY